MKRIKKSWDEKKVESQVDQLLGDYDDGELFVEEVFSENILFDDNKIKNASYDQDRGFGLRAVYDDSVCFTHNSDLNEESINTAVKFLKSSRLELVLY